MSEVPEHKKDMKLDVRLARGVYEQNLPKVAKQNRLTLAQAVNRLNWFLSQPLEYRTEVHNRAIKRKETMINKRDKKRKKG